jgi:HlyD family secretion protein
VSLVNKNNRSKKKLFRQVAALLIVIAAGIAGWLFLHRDITDPILRYTGYVISDNLFMSSPVSGTVKSVSVKRGQRVDVGMPLFQIDPTALEARAQKTRAQIQEAESQSAVQQASLESAEAALTLAISDLDRLLTAEKENEGAISQKDIDKARETVTRMKVEVVSTQNRIEASKAQISSGMAALREIEYQLTELSPVSPVSGRVEEVIYKTGEWVPANAAVISLVPDDEIKIRFYVPQSRMQDYPSGTPVSIAYDGGPSGMKAVGDFVSTRPEYTPPIIYSLETRDKLVFMVEAVPDDPARLIPGQPIDVRPILKTEQ